MRKISLHYSVIDHDFRLKHGLNFSDVVLLDCVYILQNNKTIPGWCYASNEHFSDFFGYTDRGIQKIKAKLITKGLLLEKTDPGIKTKLLQTTETYNAFKRGELSRVVDELSSGVGATGELSSGELSSKKGEQSSPNIYKDTNNKSLKSKSAQKNEDEDEEDGNIIVNEFDNKLIVPQPEQVFEIDLGGFQPVEIEEASDKPPVSRPIKKDGAYFAERARKFYPERGTKPDTNSPLYLSWLDFEEAWRVYPTQQRRNTKQESWVSWSKALKIDRAGDYQAKTEEIREIIKHIEKSCQCRDWKEGYAPQMTTYLNQRSWEAEIGEKERSERSGEDVPTQWLEGFGESVLKELEGLICQSEGKVRAHYENLKAKLASIQVDGETDYLRRLRAAEELAFTEFCVWVSGNEMEEIKRQVDGRIGERRKYMTAQAYTDSFEAWRDEAICEKYGIKKIIT